MESKMSANNLTPLYPTYPGMLLKDEIRVFRNEN